MYYKKKFTPFTSLSSIVLLSFIFTSFSTHASSVGKYIELNIEGTKYNGVVGDLDRYSLHLTPDESVLIEVTQPNSDLKILLFRVNNNNARKLVFESSIPAKKWITEQILINSNQCLSCELRILPVESIDQSGKYQLSLKRLSSINDKAEIAFHSLMTTASTQWFAAEQSTYTDANSLNQMFQKIESLYIEAYRVGTSFDSSQERQRSLYFASEISHLLIDYVKQKEQLLALIQLNKDPNDSFRLRSLFDLGDLANTQPELELNIYKYYSEANQLALYQKDYMMQAKIASRLGLFDNRMNAPKTSYEYFSKAYKHFEFSGDWRSVIEGLINLGWSSSNIDNALNYYYQALSYSVKTELLELEVDSLIKIGTIYGRLGNIDQALHFIDRALVLSKSFSPTVIDGRAKQAKAKIFLNIGMFDLAKDIFEEALLAYSKIKSTNDEMNIRYFLARVHNALGNYEKAENYSQQVLEFDKIKYVEQSQLITNDIVTGYNSLTEIAIKQNDYKQAISYANQASLFLKNVNDEKIKGKFYSQLGISQFYNKQYDASTNHLLKAKKIQQKANDKNGLSTTNFWIASTIAVNGSHEDKNQAIETLAGILEDIQLTRKNITRVDLSRSYIALQQDVVGLQISLMQDIGMNPSRTLAVSEQFRAQTLNEKLLNYGITNLSSLEVYEKRTALQKQLQSKVISYHQLSDPVSRQEIIKQTRKIAVQLEKLEAEQNKLKIVSNTNKNDAQAGVTHTRIGQLKIEQTNISDIQQQLDLKTLLLYYDISSSRSYLWAVSSNEVKQMLLPTDEVLSQQIKDVLKLVRTSPETYKKNRDEKQDKAIDRLSASLLPLPDIDWNSIKKIIIFPDGPIHYLPFSLLKLPENQGQLLTKTQISYAPSLDVWQHLINRQRNPSIVHQLNDKNEILIVAHPTIISPNKKNYSVDSLYGGFETSELPYTQKEADSIIKVAGNKAQLLSRNNASKERLLVHSLERYQLLHFATHGLANSDLPALGGLVFSNVETDNNLLLAPEIMNLNLNAELVVLSGCETAVGRLIDGEGLQGLSRAFFEAGAKRVIASLWSVQDDATAVLMGSFYRFLLDKNKSPSEALQLAKLYVKNFRRKNNQKPWKDPFYWAGFVLQGNEESWIDRSYRG